MGIEKSVIELFAGVGGFRLGLERSNSDWKVVWANQWEPSRKLQHAFECYNKNFGESDSHSNIDIAEVDKYAIPDGNLLVGGFPCQDYSVAATLKHSGGIEGKKGVLWWSIYETLIAKNPKFVLLENVDRLLKSPASQRGRDFGIMLSCFHNLDYSVEWRVINAAEYGEAQRRRRLFIFAYKNNTKYFNSMKKHKDLEILLKDGFFATTFPVEEIFTKFSTSHIDKDILKISEQYSFLFENSGYMKDGEIKTIKTIPIFEQPIPLKDIMELSVDKSYEIDNFEKWEYLKGAKKIRRTSQNGHEYIYSEGAMSFPDDINLPARTILTSETGVSRSTHVVKDFTSGKLRVLTEVEAERIQGFPDNWTNTGMPSKFRYFCMGNALVVNLIERMGKELSKIFELE